MTEEEEQHGRCEQAKAVAPARSPAVVGIDGIPYLNRSNLQGRQITILPYWDGADWHAWIPKADLFLVMRPTDTDLSDYVAREAAHPSDLWIPFVNLMWQRASWPEICPLLSAVREDFHNLFASTAKIRHFHSHRSEIAFSALSAFVSTELEYILTVARSVFDLVQEIVGRLWKHVVLKDPASEKLRKQREHLPTTFSGFCFHKGTRRTVDEMTGGFAIPLSLAQAYQRQLPFFCKLRSMRDQAVHGIDESTLIFSTEKGFAIDSSDRRFGDLVSWKEEHRYNTTTLVTLLPWLAHVVLGVVESCSDIVAAFASEIELPPEIAPGLNVFLRSPCSEVVGDLIAAAQGHQLWWQN